MLDLKEYGIVMWDAEKIASFRRTLLDWYDREKRAYLGVELRIPTISGSVKSCYNKLKCRLSFPITSAF